MTGSHPARRTPLPWKMMAVAFIFIGITAVSAAMTVTAIAVQSAVRSYVTAANYWSRAQQDAAFLLYRYGQTADPRYLARFETAMRVPVADRAARLEMQKPDFNRDLAAGQLSASGQHFKDVDDLIRLFRCCSRLAPLRRLVDIWEQSDQYVFRLQSFAAGLESELKASLPSEIIIGELLVQVETADDEVNPLSREFTSQLGEMAREVSFWLMLATATIVLLLVAVGTYLSLRIIRSIRGSEEQYRTLMQSAGDGLVVVDRADGRVLEINECAERMIGRTLADVIGLPYASLFREADVNLQPGHEQAPPQLLSLLGSTGPARNVEVNCSATQWNQRAALLAIVRDVSLRLRTERMLRVATNAMANMSEAVVITDERFRVLSVNHAFTSITGYAEAEVLGLVPGYPGVRSADRRKLRQVAGVLKRTGRWLGELQYLRKTGEAYPMRLSVTSIPESDGRISHHVGIFSDNSAFRVYEDRLKHLASHDMLTGLSNRADFEAAAGLAIRRAQANGGRLALLFIDLDGFKGVNDTYGHAAGDAILRIVGERIRRCLRPGDFVARVGGDEFTVLLDDVGGEKDAARLARALLAAVCEAVQVEEQSISLSASIGISFYPQDAADVDALVSHADMAMYEAKSVGRNNFQAFSSRMSLAVNTRLALLNGLRHAAERGQFALHYQPLTELVSGRILGFEALLQWNHPQLGLVQPAHFIALAEEVGMIDAISDWVLRAACAQGVRWQARGIRDIGIAVNLSPRNFWDPELPNRVARILDESGWPPSMLCLEITEGTVMGKTNAEESLTRLGELGVKLAIDDFGIGYSSLGSLQRFPVHVLKIDRTFTSGIPENSENLALVRTIIALAGALGLTVIAEGIETRSQHDALLAEGCSQGQGYLYGKPLPAAQAEALLLAARVRGAAELTG